MLGGTATRPQLLAHVSRRELDGATSAGAVVRHGRGRYGLPGIDEAAAIAHSLRGTLCLTSAALLHGWAVKLPPPRPHVMVARNRRLTAEQVAAAVVHRGSLDPEELAAGVTSKETTLLHCLRRLPEDEALAVADSAAREGDGALLRRVAQLAQGAGAARVRRIAGLAREEAANPFESVLRWITLGVPGLHAEPQRLITSVTPWARPDLVDLDLRIAIEADSFEWHGGRAELRRDARRYNALVADNWIVLRFSWEDVMFEPDSVRSVLVTVTERARKRTEVA